MACKESKEITSNRMMGEAHRNALIKTMIELAHRGPHETSLMVRCANAGGLKEITDHVKSMRLMFKRFTGGREQRWDKDGSTQPNVLHMSKKEKSRMRSTSTRTPRKKAKKRTSTALRAEDGII